jgi:hypothetical protein
MLAAIHIPTGLTPVHNAETIFDVAEAAILAGFLAWAAVRRHWVLIMLLAGTAIAAFVEPLDDVSSRLWFSVHMHRPFLVFGRTWAVFFPIGYALYYGLGSWATKLVMERKSRDFLFTFALFGAIFDAAIEVPWTHTRLYVYYGPQPFKISGFPLYWAFVNTAYLYLNAYVLFVLRDWLKDRRILLVPVFPIVGIGLIYGLCWPTWIVMNTTAASGVMWAVSLFTMAASTAFIAAICVAVDRYGSPLRILARPAPAESQPDLAVREPERQPLVA